MDTTTVESIGRSSARSATAAQRIWAVTPLKLRLAKLRHFRALLAEHGGRLARTIAMDHRCPVAEALSAQVIPLAEACKFLEREAGRILSPRRLRSRGRPLWLNGVRAEVNREPLGVVLIIAPSNYPLFLPGVQVLQALVAGNAVLLKPGRGGTPCAQALSDLLLHAGFDHHLVQILPEPPESAQGAIRAGVAKVVMTGSAESGAAVLAELAPHLTPAAMELSGCDAAIVRADADLDLAVRALLFGVNLNGGATCIAPRRILVHRSIATEFEGRLALALRSASASQARVELQPGLRQLLEEAFSHGAHLLGGKLFPDGRCLPPLVMAGVASSMRLLHEDIFAPVMSLVTVADDNEAAEVARHCPYALGATIFSSNDAAARDLARRLRAGLVIINDMIVPSADPRIPFGGRGRSGFGVTRGAEGLLEMTAPKVISLRRSKFLPHLDPPAPADASLFENFLLAAHGRGFMRRCSALAAALRLTFERRGIPKPSTPKEN